MKIWYELMILAFITLYSGLSLALLGHWAYDTAKRHHRHPWAPAPRMDRAGGVVV